MGEESTPERPGSRTSHASLTSHHSSRLRISQPLANSVHSAESTPLLSRDVDQRSYSDRTTNHEEESGDTSSLRSLQDGSPDKKRRRWPIVVAITLLSLIVITILGLGFAAPAVIEEYAKEAIAFEPTDLSIDSITAYGVKARILGDFTLDASRVAKKPVRDLGRFGTWIAREVESKRSKVRVYLPEYGNILLGVADIPSIVFDVRNKHTTHVDLVTDLVAGDIVGIRGIISDWVDGRLGQLRVVGIADVDLQSGIWHLGTKRISQSLTLEGILPGTKSRSFRYRG